MAAYRRPRYILPELMKFEAKSVRRMDHKFGTGCFGIVEVLEVNGQRATGKCFHESLLDPHNLGVDMIMRRFASECQFLSSIQHPNIVNFIGVCFFQEYAPYVISEYMYSSLDNLINRPGKIIQYVKYGIFIRILKGLGYLHSNTPPLIHRDLTSHNILLNESASVVKIADLGNALLVDPEKVNEALCQNPVSLTYMPPEVVNGNHQRYDVSLDIFSFGHLALYSMIELFPGHLLPKHHCDENKRLIRSEVERRKKYLDMLNEIVMTKSAPIVEIITRCLDDLPQKRPDITEVIEQINFQNSLLSCEDTYDLPPDSLHAESVNSLLRGEPELLELYTAGNALKLRKAGWKSYVFQLQDSRLIYQKKSRDIITKIPVSSITSMDIEDTAAFRDKSKFYFKINFSTAISSWSLRTFTEQKRSNWINAINQYMQQTNKIISEPTFDNKDDEPVIYQTFQVSKRNSCIQDQPTEKFTKDEYSPNPSYCDVNEAQSEMLSCLVTRRQADDVLPPLPSSSVNEDSDYQINKLPLSKSGEDSASHTHSPLEEYYEALPLASPTHDSDDLPPSLPQPEGDNWYDDLVERSTDSGDYEDPLQESTPPIPPKMRKQQQFHFDSVTQRSYNQDETSGSEDYYYVDLPVASGPLPQGAAEIISSTDNESELSDSQNPDSISYATLPSVRATDYDSEPQYLALTEEHEMDSLEHARLQVDCSDDISLGSLSPYEITTPSASPSPISDHYNETVKKEISIIHTSDPGLKLESPSKRDPIEMQTNMLLKLQQALEAMRAAYAYMPPEIELSKIRDRSSRDISESNFQFQDKSSSEGKVDIKSPKASSTLNTNVDSEESFRCNTTNRRNSPAHSVLMKECLMELLSKTPLIPSNKLLVIGNETKKISPQLKRLTRAESADVEGGATMKLLVGSIRSQANYNNIAKSQISNMVSIGQGQFGFMISRAELHHNGGIMQILVNTTEKQIDQEKRDTFLWQQATVAAMIHPNIIRSFLVRDQESPMIVTELLPIGDLKTFLINNKRSIQQLLNYMLDVSMGMHYLAQKGLIHRNIAARSIMVGRNEKCKISNFTFIVHKSVRNDIPDSHVSKLVRWMAPESLDTSQNKNVFSTASDVWSFGVLLWEIKNPTQEPYNDMETTEEVLHIRKNNASGHCLPVSKEYPHEVQDMMKACWQKDPLQRPSFLLIAQIFTNLI